MSQAMSQLQNSGIFVSQPPQQSSMAPSNNFDASASQAQIQAMKRKYDAELK